MIEDAEGELDQAKRVELFKQADHILCNDEAAIVPTFVDHAKPATQAVDQRYRVQRARYPVSQTARIDDSDSTGVGGSSTVDIVKPASSADLTVLNSIA